MSRLLILGTSHIAKESVEQVRAAFENKPDIVALELDRARFFSIMNKNAGKVSLRDIKRIGFKGFLFAVIASWGSRQLGKMVGVEPGDEMRQAIRLAKQNNVAIALIDQDIRITLQRFSKSLTWREKLNFLSDIFLGMFFRKREMKRLGISDIDLSKVPSKEIIAKLLFRMRERYPNVYKVLVAERNEVMAKNLKMLLEANPEKTILAIVGAGHEDELKQLISC
ncbi:MAG: TraB/GumN family protein [Candidatus Woesearchaeota archaeon]